MLFQLLNMLFKACAIVGFLMYRVIGDKLVFCTYEHVVSRKYLIILHFHSRSILVGLAVSTTLTAGLLLPVILIERNSIFFQLLLNSSGFAFYSLAFSAVDDTIKFIHLHGYLVFYIPVPILSGLFQIPVTIVEFLS